MSTATRALAPAPRTGVLRTTLLLASAVILAVLLNVLVATVAVAAGAPAGYGPLAFPDYAGFTVVGVLVGWVGWRVVRRRARNPRRVLSVLVPVVAVLSFVPDVLLLAFGFIPGTTAPAVIALMAMHVVTIGVAVPAYVLASRSRRR